MQAIARANTPHGLIDDVFGFLRRARLTTGVYLRKILFQLSRKFVFSFLGYGRGFDGADADNLALQSPS
jgi:hypothetical protein